MFFKKCLVVFLMLATFPANLFAIEVWEIRGDDIGQDSDGLLSIVLGERIALHDNGNAVSHTRVKHWALTRNPLVNNRENVYVNVGLRAIQDFLQPGQTISAPNGNWSCFNNHNVSTTRYTARVEDLFPHNLEPSQVSDYNTSIRELIESAESVSPSPKIVIYISGQWFHFSNAVDALYVSPTNNGWKRLADLNAIIVGAVGGNGTNNCAGGADRTVQMAAQYGITRAGGYWGSSILPISRDQQGNIVSGFGGSENLKPGTIEYFHRGLNFNWQGAEGWPVAPNSSRNPLEQYAWLIDAHWDIVKKDVYQIIETHGLPVDAHPFPLFGDSRLMMQFNWLDFDRSHLDPLQASPGNIRTAVYDDFLIGTVPGQFDEELLKRKLQQYFDRQSFVERMGKNPMTGLGTFDEAPLGTNTSIAPYTVWSGADYSIVTHPTQDNPFNQQDRSLRTSANWSLISQAVPFKSSVGGTVHYGVSRSDCGNHDWSPTEIIIAPNARTHKSAETTVIGIRSAGYNRAKVTVLDGESFQSRIESPTFEVSRNPVTNRIEYDVTATLDSGGVSVRVDGVERLRFSLIVPVGDTFYMNFGNRLSPSCLAAGGNIMYRYLHTQALDKRLSIEKISNNQTCLTYSHPQDVFEDLRNSAEFFEYNGVPYSRNQFIGMIATALPWKAEGTQNLLMLCFEDSAANFELFPSSSLLSAFRYTSSGGRDYQDLEFVVRSQ